MIRFHKSTVFRAVLFSLIAGAASPLIAAGPDIFGYVSIDSTQPGGPTFSFTDISTTGTHVTFFDADALPGAQNANADDGVALAIQLSTFNNGLGFPFYGALHTDVNMSTNGFLHFDLNGFSDSLSNNCPIQNATEPNNIIAVMWDDMVLRNPPSTLAGGYVETFDVCPYTAGGTGSCVVFQWDNADHFGGGIDSFDYQAVLYDTGNILMLYPEGAGATPANPPFNPEHGSGSTTGLENATATDSITHVCDTINSLPANFAVLFTYPAPRVDFVVTVSACVANAAGPGDPTCNDICSADKTLTVAAGASVKYCYKITNTGTTTITGISIVDDKLGIVPVVPPTLAPGASVTVFQKATIATDTINIATLNYTALTGKVVALTDTDTVSVDTDGDGKFDKEDNCPTVANADQANADNDPFGDACDGCVNDPAGDADADGICGDVDNCPAVANTDQLDTDNDSKGDACDACPKDAVNDIDGDGDCGDVDNCPTVANADQANADGDGLGDACDACPNDAANDADGDTICGNVDNCPTNANTDQADADADGIGDVCDPTPEPPPDASCGACGAGSATATAVMGAFLLGLRAKRRRTRR